MRKIVFCLLGMLLVASAVMAAEETSTAVVATKCGKVQGIMQEGSMAFL